MIKQVSYNDAFTLWGDPGTEDGKANILKHIVKIPVPYTLKPANINYIECHEYIARSTEDALGMILSYFGHKFISENKLDYYAGTYVHRMTTDGKYWAAHAWGVAHDFNVWLAPYKVPSLLPWHFVEAFKRQGFWWGCDLPYFNDGMHFSAIHEDGKS